MTEVLILRTDNYSTIECLEDGCEFCGIIYGHSGNDVIDAARAHADHAHILGEHLTLRFGPGEWTVGNPVPPPNTSMIGAYPIEDHPHFSR